MGILFKGLIDMADLFDIYKYYYVYIKLNRIVRWPLFIKFLNWFVYTIDIQRMNMKYLYCHVSRGLKKRVSKPISPSCGIHVKLNKRIWIFLFDKYMTIYIKLKKI